jgi:hypothetical protein
MKNFLCLAAVLTIAGSTLWAQWLRVPTPGIPRTADGKADLAGPVPRTAEGRPDLSGMWQMVSGSYVVNIAQDLDPGDVQPSAEALYRRHLDEFAKNDPACFLPSGPRYYITGIPKIVQTPSLVLILNDDLTYRQIFLDGRHLPKDPAPSFMGYSVGHWKGDTLVVESIGFTERTLLDTGGHPHTDGLQITERFHRRDFGHIDHEVTFNDPALYAKPITVPDPMQYVADDELIEFICRENERDYQHIGRVSDQMQHVDASLLARYVGVYSFSAPGAGNDVRLTVTLSGNELWIDRSPWMKGKDSQRLIPISETTFDGNFGRRMTFIKDDQGNVARLVFLAPEPGLRDIVAVKEK